MKAPRTANPLALASLLVAVLALVVALGGGVYAAAQINGNQLVNKSVAGTKLKDDTIGGSQVNEASLRGLARSENFRRVRFETTITSGSLNRQVLALGRLLVRFTCSRSGSSEVDYAIDARSTAGNTGWDINLAVNSNFSNPITVLNGGLMGTATTTLTNDSANNGGWTREVGAVVFNNNSANETITLNYAIYAASNAANSYCNLAGTAARVTS